MEKARNFKHYLAGLVALITFIGVRGSAFLRQGNMELAISDFRKACEFGDNNGCNALKTIMSHGQNY